MGNSARYCNSSGCSTAWGAGYCMDDSLTVMIALLLCKRGSSLIVHSLVEESYHTTGRKAHQRGDTLLLSAGLGNQPRRLLQLSLVGPATDGQAQGGQGAFARHTHGGEDRRGLGAAFVAGRAG